MTEPNADDLAAVRAAWPLSDRYRDAELWHAIAIPRLLTIGRQLGWADPMAAEWLAAELGADRLTQDRAGILTAGDGPDRAEVEASFARQNRNKPIVPVIRRYPWGVVEWRADTHGDEPYVSVVVLNRDRPSTFPQRIGSWLVGQPIRTARDLAAGGAMALIGVLFVLGYMPAFAALGNIADLIGLLVAGGAGLVTWLTLRLWTNTWVRDHTAALAVPNPGEPIRYADPTIWDCLTRATAGAERLRTAAPQLGPKIDAVMAGLARDVNAAPQVARQFSDLLRQVDETHAVDAATAGRVLAPQLDELSRTIAEDLTAHQAGHSTLWALDHGTEPMTHPERTEFDNGR